MVSPRRFSAPNSSATTQFAPCFGSAPASSKASNHRAGDAAVGIEQPRLLDHGAAAFEHIDLALRLMLDRLHHEADAVDVLGLGPRAELAVRLAHTDINVGAHRAFLHIAVARAD